MRLTQQEGMIHQLMLGKTENHSVNVYFVEEENELTLIDTALPDFTKHIVQTAQKFNKPVTKILLTHAHHDHLDGLDAIKQTFPNAAVYISKREDKLLHNDFTIEPDEPDTPIQGIFIKDLVTGPDVLIQNGDRVGSLIAIAVPGHTPGSMAYLDERNNGLIAGDAFQMIGGLAVAGVLRPAFPMPAKGTWSKELAVVSARKLSALKPSVLAVGHGEMLIDPCKAMDLAIDEAELHLLLMKGELK